MPSNSAVQPAMHSVRVWRGTGEGAFRRYEVPASQNQTILDLVTYIQRVARPVARLPLRLPGRDVRLLRHDREWAAALDLPHSCREGRGRGRDRHRAAGEHAGGQGPRRRHARVLRQMGAGERRLRALRRRGRGFRRRRAGLAGAPARRTPRSSASAAASAMRPATSSPGTRIISGPAALNRAWTLVNDLRDRGQPERLLAVAGDAGCHACHSHESCRTYCPKSLNPTASIAGLKRADRPRRAAGRAVSAPAFAARHAGADPLGGAAVAGAARLRHGAGALRRRPPRDDRPRRPRRALGGRDSRAHAGQRGVARPSTHCSSPRSRSTPRSACATIFAEWLGWRGRSLDLAAALFAVLIAGAGLRTVLGALCMSALAASAFRRRSHPAYVGVRGASPLRGSPRALPAAAFLGARPGDRGRGAAGDASCAGPTTR